jgi:general secretion pathway protein L
MNSRAAITVGFARWIDCVARSVFALHGWLAPPRVIKLVEGEFGKFALQTSKEVLRDGGTLPCDGIFEATNAGFVPAGISEALGGGRIELILRSDRFLFAPLELPGRAAEFLEGVVRAQIDRLTPWGAAAAAFGWSVPMQAASDRFITTIAATPLDRITPLLQAISRFGVKSVSVFTNLPESDAGGAPIKVLESGGGGAGGIERISRALRIIMFVAAFGAVATVTTEAIVDASLEAQQKDLSRQIIHARISVNSSRDTPVDSIASGHRTLQQLKHEAPSSVIVLDALSRILPDHTYVTELRIEDNKVRVTGVSKDAPSLIGLIEKSGRFAKATFFAPTTQLASEVGENFHIEADIQPIVQPLP